MSDVNLIPAHRVNARRRRVRVRRWAVALAVYAGVLLTGYGVCRAVWVDGRDVSSELNEAAQQIEESNQAIDSLGKELARAKLMLSASRKVVDQPDWSVLLELTGRTLGDQIVLKRLQVGQLSNEESRAQSSRRGPSRAALLREMPEAFSLELAGYGRSSEAVSQFVLRLEQIDLFKRVTVRKTNREPFMADDAIAFEIVCTLDGEGTPEK